MINSIFLPYKNKYLNQKCVVFGTGPSLALYKYNKTDNSIKIGVNEIIHWDEVMDYYFIGDAGNKNQGFNSNPNIYINYQPTKCKFFRSNKQVARHIPQLPQNITDTTYYTTTDWSFYHKRYKNIPSDFSTQIHEKITDGGSIIFEAIQFVLYCGFTDIDIVGCDCDYKNGTFFTKKHIDLSLGEFFLSSWKKFKNFVDNNYPQVKINIINPVAMNLFNEL